MHVVTLTLNPCVDRTLWVPEFGAPHVREDCQSGGKGVNVARVLGALGIDCIAVAPAGGEAGARFATLARAEGVALQAVSIAAETRTVDTHVRLSDRAQRVEVGAPPAMRADEVRALGEAVEAQLQGASLFAVCGSACCPAAAALGERLIARAKRLGVATLLDANGEALSRGVRALPDLVKPNQKELVQLAGRALQPGEEEQAARSLVERGVGRVLLSLGERGAVLITPESTIYCPAPRVETVNPVGSGDSFVAGYLYAQIRGASEYGALACACAAGAANAAMFPAARITKGDIERLLGYTI